MKLNERLYHVTLQVFGTEGTLLENKYYNLPAPFFPEDAKRAYMAEHPERVLRRELIVVINWSDQEDNREKLEWWSRKDKQLEEKRNEIAQKAASGEYGSGDEAKSKVTKLLHKVREDEIRTDN